MILLQDILVQAHPKGLDPFPQRLKKAPAIRVIHKQITIPGLPGAYESTGDMINRAGILYAQRSSHATTIAHSPHRSILIT